MRRLLVMGCGLALAIATAVLALPTFAFAAALLHGNLSGLPQSVLDVVVWWAWADGSGRLLEEAVVAAGKAMAVICCGPVILAALIGEAARLRAALWFVGASAALSVLLPLAAGSGPMAALAQPMALGPLLATGAIAGLVYWLIAVPSPDAAGPHGSTTVTGLASPAKSATDQRDS